MNAARAWTHRGDVQRQAAHAGVEPKGDQRGQRWRTDIAPTGYRSRRDALNAHRRWGMGANVVREGDHGRRPREDTGGGGTHRREDTQLKAHRHAGNFWWTRIYSDRADEPPVRRRRSSARCRGEGGGRRVRLASIGGGLHGNFTAALACRPWTASARWAGPALHRGAMKSTRFPALRHAARTSERILAPDSKP